MRTLQNLICFLILGISASAFADGFLTVKEPVVRDALGSQFNYYPYVNNYNPDVSLFISEKLSDKWTFTSYDGFLQGTTFVFDQGFLYSLTDRLRLGIGGTYTDGTITDTFNNSLRYKNLEGKVWAEYKLW